MQSGDSVSSEARLLPPAVRQRCRDAMEEDGTHSSRLQRSVASVLDAVHPGFEEELVEPQTGYSIDIALRSSCIAIEVDGPSHFLHTRGEHRPNGPTLLKRRLLEAVGWRLISVPFYEWDALNSLEAQRDYLQGALCDAGLHPMA